MIFSNKYSTFRHKATQYDDKMLVILNYKDGEICVTYDEIKAAVDKRKTLAIVMIVRVFLFVLGDP